MEIRSSSNYIWYTKEKLGEGATGAVFKGRNKRTGDVYAIKNFNHIGMMRPTEVRQREFEVLRKLRHENIVKIIDAETETRTQNEIIVMELCTGGSLFTLLEHPSNGYGFSEHQFKQVVKDVVAGMKHLREQGIVHRDLKPGNIMRFYKEDGSSVYKLTDFGGARELEEQEEFMSIYGTEEYLHPEMYERGVLRKQGNKAFSASVDLWSIGVTFYHIATGQLPFRPFGGRQNRNTMFRITTEKQSGIISGVQNSPGGEIEWSNKLPEQTRLSQCLIDLITPVLAGILESNPSKMMSFEKFFDSIQDIMSRKVVDVYCVGSSTFHKIYIKPDETFANLQDMVAVYTGVSAAQQKYFFKYDEFKPDLMAPASSYPSTSDDDPLLMIGGEDVLPKKIALRISKFPEMPEKGTLESDASVAKVIANCAYCSKRAVKLYVRSIKAMSRTAESVLKHFKKEMILYLANCTKVDCFHKSVCTNTNMCCASQENMIGLVKSFLSKVPESEEDLKTQVQEELKTIEDMVEQKKRNLVELAKNEDALESFKALISNVVANNDMQQVLGIFGNVSDFDSFVAEVGTLTMAVEEIYNRFRKEKHHRRLSYIDEQYHVFDRRKIEEMCNKISPKVEQCEKKRSEFCGKLREFLSKVKDQQDAADRYHNSLIGMFEADEAHQQSMQSLQVQFQQQYNTVMEKILQCSQSSLPIPVLSSASINTSEIALVNGIHDDKSTSGLVKRLENEISNLSLVTKSSTRVAKENTQYLGDLTTSLIDFCSLINKDLSASFEKLQDETLMNIEAD